MKRAVLLVVCAALVNVLILGLAVKSRRLSEQVDDLKAERDQDRRRLSAALELIDQAGAQLEATDPAQAKALRVDAGIVRQGDLGCLRPSPDEQFIFRFDELL